MNPIFEQVTAKIKADKRLSIIVIVGVIGIIMLTLSEIMPNENVEEETNEASTSSYCEYEEKLEERLEEIISSINGAGETQVMVTLESGDENVYAIEQKQSSSNDSEQIENEYVLIDESGDNNGLLLKVVEPEVRGVAVVCEGANSAQVKEEILNTVTAVLGITANRVNISKMNNGGNQ